MSRNLIKLLSLINIQNKLPSLILHWRDIILMPNNTNKSKLTKPVLVVSIVFWCYGELESW